MSSDRCPIKKRPKDLNLATAGTTSERKNTAAATGGSNKPCPNAEWSQSGAYVIGDLKIKDSGVKREVASPSGEASTSSGAVTSETDANQSFSTDALSGIHPDDLEDHKILGRGASGTVMLVKHKKTNVLYAVKVINISAGASGVDTRMVLQEINSIDHACPFLVRAFTAFLREKHLHIVQEYMDKGSLADILRVYRKGVPENILVIIASQLIQGLAHLHSGGSAGGLISSSSSAALSSTTPTATTPTSASAPAPPGSSSANPPPAKKSKLHRDLKPANILACSQGMVKISDFGIATTVGSSGNSTMVGTATYMSPERIRGERYNISSDIWSAGLVLCELCLGQYPFKNCDSFLQLLRVITKPQQFDFPPGTSEACQSFMMSCMKQKPDERPTAQALLQHPFLANNKSEGCSEELKNWLAALPSDSSP